MYKIDLHTHSEASKDGGIRADEYAFLLENEILDYIAVTDHDRLDFALDLQKALGEQIIVGQEITTTEGEIIGLYISEHIPAQMTLKETINEIRKQGGLVYVPHPFETVRKGLNESSLNRHKNFIDIIETQNGRAVIQNKSSQTMLWLKNNTHISPCASSDAHGLKGSGCTYAIIAQKPKKHTLVNSLKYAKLVYKKPPFVSLLYPKYNRFKHIIWKGY